MDRPRWIFLFSAIAAIAGVVQTLEYAGIKPSGGYPGMSSPLVWGIGFLLVSVGSSIWGFIRLSAVGHPLKIVSANWGIGGNAYKDVTGIVRGHAKQDSVSIPASVGLLGDPYPNTPKHLIVTYSFARNWDIRVSEGQSLVLPEKDGQEQARLEREKQKAQLASMSRGASDPRRSLLEARAFTQLENEFNGLSWLKKLALLLLCEKNIRHEQGLRFAMEQLELGPADYLMFVIRKLRECSLVEFKPDGTLIPNPAHLKDVEEIVFTWDLDRK